MPKFGLLHENLLAEGVIDQAHIHAPEPAADALIGLVHEASYVKQFSSGGLDDRAIKRIGLPWSHALVNRTVTAVGGAVLTASLALDHGLACNLAGGTHHAHADFGSGFCILNDLAVAARWVQEVRGIDRVLIVDLDVHQGDGTARIFASDPSVFTFSMHCGKNFPLRKAKSDWDIDLAAGTGDGEYLRQLQDALPDLMAYFKPGLVLYDAGVDVHQDDRLGYLALTDQGIAQRDRLVITACLEAGVPVAGVIGGGYDQDHARLARRHGILHRVAGQCADASDRYSSTEATVSPEGV